MVENAENDMVRLTYLADKTVQVWVDGSIDA